MSLRIPFNNLGPRFTDAAADYRAAVERVLSRGWYVLGPEVRAFEDAFAAYHGGGHAIGVANGTDAIELALRAAGIGPGDEVITTTHTAVATGCGVERSGAKPVFADIDPTDYCLCPKAVAAAVTPRTRAVVAVHLYGQPAKLAELRAVCDRHKLLLIEDCAQAHGATYNGQKVGTFGDLAAFSFYPTKNLGAFGDGGAVFTRDPALADRVKRLRNYGQTDRYHHVDAGGFNSRLDEIQAALLTIALGRLDAHNAERGRGAAKYLSQIRAGGLPTARAGTGHVYHLFVLRRPDRDAFRARLAAAGVETLVHYPIPIHRQPAYAHLGVTEGALPEAERAAREVVSLPLFVGITDEQLDAVARASNDAIGVSREAA